MMPSPPISRLHMKNLTRKRNKIIKINDYRLLQIMFVRFKDSLLRLELPVVPAVTKRYGMWHVKPVGIIKTILRTRHVPSSSDIQRVLLFFDAIVYKCIAYEQMHLR